MRGQDQPVPFDRSTLRRGNAPGGAVAALPRFTAGGQAAQAHGDASYYGARNDDAIVRDRTPWMPRPVKSGAGTGTVDWTACGPARPQLHMRNVTVRRMAGTDSTRFLANPKDPRQGLHSQTPHSPRGNVQRYAAGLPTIRPGRTDRLSPARYVGQSYSQTTLEQGATKGKRR